VRVFLPRRDPYGAVEIYDVSLAGFGGDPIQAWLTWAQVGDEPQPAVVEFVGYGGGRDVSGTYLQWASVGYIHLLVDIRGGAPAGGRRDHQRPARHGSKAPQGSWRGASSTPSPITIGRIFTDAVRAVQVVRTISRVDRAKVSVARISQGGGISLAVAGLVNDLFAVTRRTRHFCATSNVRWTSVNEARTQRSADTSRSTVGRPEEPLTL
jgi:cephalosporin-C deacetylase